MTFKPYSFLLTLRPFIALQLKESNGFNANVIGIYLHDLKVPSKKTFIEYLIINGSGVVTVFFMCLCAFSFSHFSTYLCMFSDICLLLIS